ncbi:unnamed protein product [Paramecium octaurelia]|uniref:Uncharacterized protein n=1 Tax=Paramecium octaurelia TaxID=43137 RepID=A0A8S1W3R7_PAROT|nr:unnamed protein product [Paramecium octaurelia]
MRGYKHNRQHIHFFCYFLSQDEFHFLGPANFFQYQFNYFIFSIIQKLKTNFNLIKELSLNSTNSIAIQLTNQNFKQSYITQIYHSNRIINTIFVDNKYLNQELLYKLSKMSLTIYFGYDVQLKTCLQDLNFIAQSKSEINF